MKVFSRRVQKWLTLFCILTAIVSVFVFVGSSYAEDETEDGNGEGGMEMQSVTGFQAKEVQNPTCLDNYETWPTSSKGKINANWSTNFLVPVKASSVGVQEFQQFMDINGDGLLDYVYVLNRGDIMLQKESNYSNYGSSFKHILVDGIEMENQKWRYQNTCVYLNNGHGWDVAYRCLVKGKSIRSETTNTGRHYYYEPVFYGDCADVS